MLWPYSLKAFAEQFNVINLDYDGITPMEKCSGQQHTLILKITTHGSIQFMSWMQYYKAI